MFRAAPARPQLRLLRSLKEGSNNRVPLHESHSAQPVDIRARPAWGDSSEGASEAPERAPDLPWKELNQEQKRTWLSTAFKRTDRTVFSQTAELANQPFAARAEGRACRGACTR